MSRVVERGRPVEARPQAQRPSLSDIARELILLRQRGFDVELLAELVFGSPAYVEESRRNPRDPASNARERDVVRQVYASYAGLGYQPLEGMAARAAAVEAARAALAKAERELEEEKIFEAYARELAALRQRPTP